MWIWNAVTEINEGMNLLNSVHAVSIVALFCACLMLTLLLGLPLAP
jgi:hypothetical protein